MKIAILTQPLHANYGGLLQNYALQQTLIRMGHDPVTLDWAMPYDFKYKLSKIKAKVSSLFFQDKNKAHYELNRKEKSIIQQNTEYFISKYIQHTSTIKSSREFLKQSVVGGYQAYVVGSDQCWRPGYNYFLHEMFLSFLTDLEVKRIAYAASFGTDIWEFNKSQTADCSTLAKKFNMVTVREDSGVDLCRKYLGIDAVHVLDPTLLLSKHDYIRLITEENEPKSNGSLFYYVLDPDSKKKAFIESVSEKMGLTPFSIMPRYQAETRTKEIVKTKIESCIFPSVTLWLRAFLDAEMTIVDSFHGMVFSIIFNKPFWVIGNPTRGMSRFTSLLKIFNLEDRLININSIDQVDLKKNIDWNMVNACVDNYRHKSLELLRKSLL